MARFRYRIRPRGRDPTNLIHPSLSTHIEQVVAGGLWNCQSAVQKAEFISGYASMLFLNFLALTETWITPENTATPTALSDVYSFSHTPRAARRGGGTGLLISKDWKYSLCSLLQFSPSSFEFHAVTVSHLVKLTIAVVYRPSGPIGDFLEELDTLVSHFPDDGSGLTLLGDFNIQTEKLHPLVSLLSSFDLALSPSPPTHKAGNILDLIFTRHLRAAKRKWRKSKLPEDLLAFQSLLSTFSSSLSAAKTAFFCNKIQTSASNPKKLFQTFSSLLQPHPLSPPPPSSLTISPTSLTRRLKGNSGAFEAPKESMEDTSPSPPSLSHFSPLSANEVLHLVTSSRPTTCSLDPVPSPLLHSAAPDLLPYLTNLINTSLTSGSFPSASRTARVTPLLKKPAFDPSEIKNYRPVSLLPFLSKTLERAVFKQLSSCLHQNNLLDPYQSGFKVGHSTETALLAVTESLQTARASSLSSVLILLDLSAAFDTVNHDILLSTLEGMGVSGSALSMFSSYLTDRFYQVTLRGSVLKPCRLTTGVPQGSVLGPLLFSLYTSSLGSVIHSHYFSYHSYADDTQLILSFPPSDTQVEARIAACLADISGWMSMHHLKLNLDKTELVFLPGKACPFRDPAITVDDSVVTSTRTARNLGVTLDDELSFSPNIASVTRSCRFLLYNIRRIHPFLTDKALQVLIQALVISRLDYCNSLLAGALASAIRPLELVQKAAARLVFNLPKFSHTTPLLRSLHWLPVAARIQFKTLVLAYRAVEGTAHSYLKAMVKHYTPTRPLRSAANRRLAAPSLRGPCARSTRSRLFSVLAPRWWNDLPTDIRTAELLPIFRRRLKTHLFKKNYPDPPS
ncbi:uncharacterized protein LOC142373735 [Odontesthes bonariensis]|uniref:uncharacterized protein LOC142373735 n=1 Tax=Odontesthes bonariensis TaxID=219752 RepID=UPI003F587673